MHASSPTQPFKRRGVQLAIASVLLSQAWTLQAQAADNSADSEAQAASKTTEATPPALGKVTVTATRREASLQSVPIAVSVLDGRKLEQSNLNSIQTIANEVPSLTFRQQGWQQGFVHSDSWRGHHLHLAWHRTHSLYRD